MNWKPLECALAPVAVAAALAYINWLFWHYTEYQIMVVLDSASYLQAGPMRQMGYSALAGLVKWLGGDLRWIGVLQLNLLLLSFVALGHGFGRLAGSRLLGLALTLLLCGLLPLVKVAEYFLTEAVFTSAICLQLAALCHYLRGHSMQESGTQGAGTSLPAFAMGASLALAYLVRPAALPFAALLALPLLHGRWRACAWALAPALACLLLIASVNKIRHNAFTIATPSGIVLISYVGNLLESGDGAGTRHEQALEELAAREPSLAQAGVPWPGGYWRGAGKTGDLGWRFLKKMNPEGSVYPPTFARLQSDNRTSLEWAWLIVSKHPLEYAKLVAANDYALWRHGFLRGSAALHHQDILQGAGDLPASALDAYLVSNRLASSRPWVPGLYARHGMDTAYLLDAEAQARREARAGDVTLLGLWWNLLAGNRALVIALALLLCPLSIALLLTRHRRETLVQLAACAAFLLHANTLFLALLHPAYIRYALPLNPLLLLFLLAMAAALIRLAAARKGGSAGRR